MHHKLSCTLSTSIAVDGRCSYKEIYASNDAGRDGVKSGKCYYWGGQQMMAIQRKESRSLLEYEISCHHGPNFIGIIGCFSTLVFSFYSVNYYNDDHTVIHLTLDDNYQYLQCGFFKCFLHTILHCQIFQYIIQRKGQAR